MLEIAGGILLVLLALLLLQVVLTGLGLLWHSMQHAILRLDLWEFRRQQRKRSARQSAEP